MFGTVLLCSGQSNMEITLDAFSSYIDQPEMNVTNILLKSGAYGDRVRIHTVSSSGGSAAPYSWAIPNASTLSGGGSYFSAGGCSSSLRFLLMYSRMLL
jgi:hypothetical protein